MASACCTELAKHGADIVVVAREPEEVTGGRARPHAPVSDAVAAVEAWGTSALGITADVRDKAQVEAMVERVLAECGRIDVLVNVVGGSWGETFRAGPLMELTEHDLVEAYRVNVVTMFQCSVAAMPAMKEQGQRLHHQHRFVAGRSPSPDSPAYGAAKAGVINMTLSMAQAWGRRCA